jgi:DUF1680 family protein
MDKTENVFDVAIPFNIKFTPQPEKIDNSDIMALKGKAQLIQHANWNDVLYHEINNTTKPVNIKLIPYYAWANRGKTDMTVWMSLIR